MKPDAGTDGDRRMFRPERGRRLVTLALATLLTFGGCVTWSTGVEPIRPRHRATTTEQPIVLEWTAAAPEGAELVMYELAVFDDRDATIYHANDLVDTHHQLETSLSPGSYRWTVCPTYFRNGTWTSGECNRRKYLLIAIVYWQWGETLYRFRQE